MTEVNWIDEVLDFAIEREREANRFYAQLATRMDNPAMRDVFERFAREELGHKAKLEAIKQGDLAIVQTGPVRTLNIADYLVDVEARPDMEYGEALILAMKREKASYRLYLDLAEIAGTDEARQTFLWLAGEEAQHKLRFETEYDDSVLKED